MKEQLDAAIVKVLKKVLDKGNVTVKRGFLGGGFTVYAPDGKKLKKMFTIKRENGNFSEAIETKGRGSSTFHSLHKDHIKIDGKTYETIHSEGIYEAVLELYTKQNSNTSVAFLKNISDKTRK